MQNHTNPCYFLAHTHTDQAHVKLFKDPSSDRLPQMALVKAFRKPSSACGFGFMSGATSRTLICPPLLSKEGCQLASFVKESSFGFLRQKNIGRTVAAGRVQQKKINTAGSFSNAKLKLKSKCWVWRSKASRNQSYNRHGK